MAITDPRDIPGLVVWYDAALESGYADGATMPTLTDHSGNGNHGARVSAGGSDPLWRSAGGPTGGASVEFTGGAYFQLPDSLMGAATAGEVMVTLRTGGGTGPGVWSFSQGGGSQHYPFDDGNIYENWGANQRPGFAPGVDLSSWRTYNVWSAASDWTVRLDGVTKASSTTYSVQFNSTAAEPYWLGRNAGGARWVGRVGALVVYSRKLTTSERTDLEAWFAGAPSATESGSLAVTLPKLTMAASGTAPTPGSFAVALPVPTVALSGVAPIPGALAFTLPVPTFTATGSTPPPRTGYGLVLDSEATLTAPAPLEPLDGPVTHIVTPTVPTPVLVDGRPS